MTHLQQSLRELLIAQADIALPTEDLVHMLVPLMKSVDALHTVGRVAHLGPTDIVEADDGALTLLVPSGVEQTSNDAEVRRIQPSAGSALKIVGEYRVTVDQEHGLQVADLRASGETDRAVTKPVYLTGYRCWELEIGHHDELTDVFSVGLIFASLACGLDFENVDDVERFSTNRSNLFRLNSSLHPVLATLIFEMTDLSRHERATDLGSLARRLETYRDQPIGLDIERVLSQTNGAPKRRTAVLSHLRDRLFDLSRRNRLIHFRSTQGTVNFTVASVPVVMRIESIRSDQLCTWGGAFARDVLSGRQVPLSEWLRFEDQPYLPSALDKIIQDARRDRAEYGFTSLRLVIAFLHWHNVKEAPDERITSPLLWLPVEIVKIKGVRDLYTMQCSNVDAEFNPALRHHLRQLYDIQLPETVDLNETSLADIHADLAAQIHKTEPGINLTLQDKPAIQLIHQKAVQRLRQFQRRKGIKARSAQIVRPDFSYSSDDYRPLGLALFDKYVRPSPLPQRLAVGAAMPPSSQFMAGEPDAAERLTYAHGSGQGHRFDWQIDLTQVTAANFNYKKMSLVRDYNLLIDTVAEQLSFDRVFSIEPRDFSNDVPPVLPSSERWCVVPADNTQNKAVALARTGQSFIIQGPPGTGKSQTITNLIADFAARGKRVLFVCEKRAALDVVFHRLQQAGLDRLACLVHDSQEDKKAFVLDLKDCYEQWGGNDLNLEEFNTQRQLIVDALNRHVGVIEAFERTMSVLPQDCACDLRSLIRRLIALPEQDLALGPKEREWLPGPAAWDAQRDLANQLAAFMQDRFGLPFLADHPFALLSAATINNSQCYGMVDTLIADAQGPLDTIGSALDRGDAIVTGETRLIDALSISRIASAAITCGLTGNLDILDAKSKASAEFDRRLAKVRSLDAAYGKAADQARNWQAPLSPGDAAAALELARRLEGSFFKFLIGSWRRLKSTVQARYNFKAHAVEPSITHVLELLVAQQNADRLRQSELTDMVPNGGIADIENFVTLRQRITTEMTSDRLLPALIQLSRGFVEPAIALSREADLLPHLESLVGVVQAHLDFTQYMSINEIGTLLRDLQESQDDLPDALPILRAVHAGHPGVARALLTLPAPPETLEAAVIDEAIARYMRSAPALARFDATLLASSAFLAARAETAVRNSNAAVIRASLHRQFRDNVRRSTLSVTQLDSEGKQFKKRYSAGRREFEHEIGKTMRFRSIRELSGGDIGAVVNDLKPIWLMSPLSVSDTLPLEPNLFDVVLFDEASQIPTEEAVPALCRARQVIVVGDEMQLPPTSFFSSSLDEEEIQVVAEEDGEQISINLDADSLLNQAARNLPATLLAWHYRSRSEALISFSNAAFYEGRLVTIPDLSIPESVQAVESVPSDDGQHIAEGVERLLARPITFHHMSDGVYEKRANAAEARYIASLVRDLLFRETGLSIGIVAFSEAQQDEIDSALEALAAKDEAFASRIEQEYVREDDNQFNGLFVKNLENVQGDERDVIILSICYAPGRDGKMAMNFGPINQRGGEKRLNVIFSRAKHHMAIVSTIHADAITNTHNDGARALRTFLSFAEAQSSGSIDRAQSILATLNPDAEQVFSRKAAADSLRTAIAQQLKLRGHEVHEDVGSAAFRCDLAIVDPDENRYSLAILLDCGVRASSSEIAERYVFQPGILKSFGWRVIDIPSTDWLRSPDQVIEAIESALDGAIADEFDDNQFDPSPIPIAVLAASMSASIHTDGRIDNGTEDLEFEEYHFKQGSSSKFWKIATVGSEMTVVFGRIGTKGTQITKVFESEERAKREAAKLVLEKTNKGYTEAE